MKNASYKSRAKFGRKQLAIRHCRTLTSTFRFFCYLRHNQLQKMFRHARAKYMTSTGYYNTTNSARCRKIVGLLSFPLFFVCFAFFLKKKSSCFTYSQKYYRRRVGFHCTFRTTHIVFFPTCFSLSTSELKLLDQRSQNFTASQGT